MSHKALFDIYRMLLGSLIKSLASDELWYPNGKNSIRIRSNTHKDLIFTYTSDKNWCIETIDSFLGGK